MKKIIYTYALACLFTESQALLVRPGITIWKHSYSCRNYLMLMAQKLERDGNLEKALTHCQTVWQQMPNKNEGRPIVKEIARLTGLTHRHPQRSDLIAEVYGFAKESFCALKP